MYDLAPPSYRKEKSYEDFVVDSTMRSRFDLVSFRIEKADMSRQEAKVFVAARFDFVRFGTPETVAEDPWIKVDGTWYRKWEPVALPFPKS